MTHQLFSVIDKILHPVQNQRGAFLVLFAITLPLLMAFSAIAVDLGTVYVQRVHLQNAADAAALAGAYQFGISYTEEDPQNDPATLEAAVYTEKNSPSSTTINYINDNMPSAKNIINIYADPERNSTYSTIKIQLRERVPLYFFAALGKFFQSLGYDIPDMDTMPIAVTATAKYVPGSSGTFDGIFGYALASGNIDNKSIYINTTNILIDGNIMTNGKIFLSNHYSANLSGYVSANPNYLPVWSQLDWYNNKQMYLPMGNANGSSDALVQARSDSNAIINISENANPQIKDYISNIVTLAQSNSAYAVGGKNHIYYSDSGAALGLKTLKDSTGNNYIGFTNNNDYTYSTIVTSGDTQVNTGYDSSMTPSDDIVVIVKNGNLQANITSSLGTDNNGNPKNIILIAENGNINLQNSVPVNALIYAPNGLVTIDGNGSEIKGSIVAKNIIMTTGGQKITHTSISSGSSSSTTTKGSVTLIK